MGLRGSTEERFPCTVGRNMGLCFGLVSVDDTISYHLTQLHLPPSPSSLGNLQCLQPEVSTHLLRLNTGSKHFYYNWWQIWM